MSTSRFICRFVVGFVAIALSACTTVPYPRQDLPAEAAGSVKRIAILRVDDPERLSPPVNATTAQAVAAGAFLLLGVMVFAGTLASIEASRAGPFTRAIHAQQPRFADLLVDELQATLVRRGKEVEYLRDHRATARGSDNFEYTGMPKTADALLHARFRNLGYGCDMDGDCGPFALITAYLVDPGTGRRLFERSIIARSRVDRQKLKHVDEVVGGADLRFPDYDALMSAPAQAAEALRGVVRAAAAHLAATVAAGP